MFKGFVGILVISFSTAFSAMAETKICTLGSSPYSSHGERVVATITKASLKIEGLNSETEWNGTFNRIDGEDVEGRDGKTYLSYYWGGEEGCSRVLVDEALLEDGTRGFIKFRCRGEGYSEYKFSCRDH